MFGCADEEDLSSIDELLLDDILWSRVERLGWRPPTVEEQEEGIKIVYIAN